MATSATFASGMAPIRAKIPAAQTTNLIDVCDNSTRSKSARIEGLGIASDDASACNIQFSILSGGVSYPISTVNVPASSGTNGTAARVNVLPSIGVLAPDGIYDLWIGAGEKLQANALVTLTSGKTATITGRVRLFEAA